ncbi:MAG: ATPase, T2SS/T4P/T4SS family [Candidatus Marinimicrobia bacterium]|nr:ATPase, T2SS/T4P/T4SS family [Candidatus Neomarinimicrobiota bacterium]
MDQTVINNVHQLLKPILDQIPDTLFGLERLHHLSREISGLLDDDRRILRAFLNSLLADMKDNGASDIDMGSAGCAGKIWYRSQGEKKPDPTQGDYSDSEMDVILLNILMDQQRDVLLKDRNLDFSYSIDLDGSTARLRGDMYFDLGHLGLNMRMIGDEIRPFAGLGLHPEIAKALSLKHTKKGLILVTGITGSGKSSTLDTIIDANNQSMNAHIVILGSPIEQVHKPKGCLVRHREVGADVLSFKEGAIQALRQDPDIIVIGEMRDPETIITALEVTDSGHKVFSTLHTSSTVESVDRIIGEVPANEQNRVRERLADVLSVIISQKLPRTLDGKRVLAKEVLLMIPSIRAAIKNNNLDEIYQMIQQSSNLGMITLEQDLKRLFDEKKISYEEALSNANNKKRFKEIVKISL